jgi:ribosomal protein L5
VSTQPRLKIKYNEEIHAQLKEQLGLENPMEVPTLEKIVLNMGLGEAIQNKKAIDEALDELGLIAGQKPKVNKARKSIANFKLREGMPIGVSVGNSSIDFCRSPSPVFATSGGSTLVPSTDGATTALAPPSS